MPITNYLNPESFRPQYDWKPKGVLAGMMYGNQMDDYNKLMEHQFALQKLGLEESNIDLAEKKAGLPLAGLKRDQEFTERTAKGPYIEELARETAKSGIEEKKFTQLEKGPEGRKAQQAEFENKIKNFDAEQIKREAIIAQSVLQQARAMGPEEGPKYAQQMYDRATKMGYHLPKEITDPSRWDQMTEGYMNTLEHLREMDKRKFDTEKLSKETIYKEEQANKRAADANARMLQAAKISATTRGSNRTPTIPRLVAETNKLERELGKDHPEYQAAVKDLSDLLAYEFNSKVRPKLEATDETINYGQRVVQKEKDPEVRASLWRKYWEKKEADFVISATKGVTPDKSGGGEPKKQTTDYQKKYGLE